MANSKGRFSLWVAPKALVFDRFFDWDFDISVGAIQGHRSRRGGTGGTSYSREMPAVGDDFSCLPQFKLLIYADSSSLLFALADSAIALQFTVCMPVVRYLLVQVQ